MLADQLRDYLAQHTPAFRPDAPDFDVFTAAVIAEYFSVKRNTVSQYLNEGVDAGEIIKINTRPVIFLEKEAFEQANFPVSKCIYKSLEELMGEAGNRPDAFSKIIGGSGSLKEAVRQIKTSAYYPGNGLPIMLSGPTGVGKSLLARVTYEYLIEERVLDKDAPFIVFNCAQYFNNPELLSSNLFGYVRGAFTGADKNTPGMLEEADGGVLFLDEVHRLNEESQEKLFTFMDQGRFRRMGESSGWHHANVRLIFATTEKLTESFLGTFLRRIPIVADIPGLSKRDAKEKIQYIYYFFIEEAKIFQKDIQLSQRVLELFCNYEYEANVGEMQNLIKFTAARAYAQRRDEKVIHIRVLDLPEKMLSWDGRENERKTGKNQTILITPRTTIPELLEERNAVKTKLGETFRKIQVIYERLMEDEISYVDFEIQLKQLVLLFMDALVFGGKDASSAVVLDYMADSFKEIFGYLEYIYQVRFNGNSMLAMTYYLIEREGIEFRWKEDERQGLSDILRLVSTQMQEEYRMVQKLKSLLENRIDTQLSIEDELFFTVFMKSQSFEIASKRMRAVIIAHGYSTASSLANVANRLLGVNLFEAFDMPMDVQLPELTKRLIQYLKESDTSQGIIILVDMGSLNDIYAKIQNYVNGPVAIFNNVSTQMALAVGDMLKNQEDMKAIADYLKENNKTVYKIACPVREKKKAIVTCCMTGMGTAIRMQQLLSDSIPEAAQIEIMAYDYARLRAAGLEDVIFRTYEVLFIVGTVNPYIESVPFVSLEQLVTGDEQGIFNQVLGSYVDNRMREQINDNIVHNFSLRRVIGTLTILDTDKILRNIEECLKKWEQMTGIMLSNSKKIALLVHISCMVERLIRHIPITEYPDLEGFLQCHKKEVEQIRKAFSVIEEGYSVVIHMAELGYIYDVLMTEEVKEAEF